MAALGNKPPGEGQQPPAPAGSVPAAATRGPTKLPVLAVKPGSSALTGSERRVAKKNSTPTPRPGQARHGCRVGDRLQMFPCNSEGAAQQQQPAVPESLSCTGSRAREQLQCQAGMPAPQQAQCGSTQFIYTNTLGSPSRPSLDASHIWFTPAHSSHAVPCVSPRKH